MYHRKDLYRIDPCSLWASSNNNPKQLPSRYKFNTALKNYLNMQGYMRLSSTVPKLRYSMTSFAPKPGPIKSLFKLAQISIFMEILLLYGLISMLPGRQMSFFSLILLKKFRNGSKISIILEKRPPTTVMIQILSMTSLLNLTLKVSKLE